MSLTTKDVLINRAIALFNEGHLKECLKETLRIRQKYPDEPFIYNFLGVLYAHTESYEDSIKNYLKAIKLNPSYFEAYNNIGVAYNSWKKSNEAIEFFDKAIQINPSYAEAYNNKGNAIKEKGEYLLAAECYEKAVSLSPNYIDAITNLGIIWDLMNDFTQSERYFRRALSLSPTNTSILYNLANCFFNAGEFKKSMNVCQEIIRINSSFYHAYNRIGLCYIKLENEEQAIDFFEKSIKVNPDYLEGLTNYGFALQKLKNYSLAAVQFEKVLTKNPISEEAFVNLIKVYFDDGRLQKSIEIARQGLSLNPKSIPILKNLISSLVLLNRLGEASLACKEILSINNSDAETTNMMGTIYEKQGFYDQAKNQFLKALQLDKNLVQAKINIATLYQLEGNDEKANEIYNDVAKEQPENAEVIYRRSAVAFKQENFQEAWKYYEYRWKSFPLNKTVWPIRNQRVWKGEKGGRLVLWKEQGIGDQIILLSLVPEVKNMCATLSIYADPRLQSLCKEGMPEINFISDEIALKEENFDYHLSLGSVPALVRNNIRDFDRTVSGYFKADSKRVESIRKELQLDGKIVIGISWKSFKSLNQTKKSVQLHDLEPIFSGLNVVLVNLQYGDVDDEIRKFREETGIEVVQCASVDNREDLNGLAALIEVCDLVLSTSNVTIHLAGALAKETWVLLPYVVVNFWWLTERPKSIWYPSLTLYRQPTLDDWDSVYESVRKDLISKIL